MPFKRLLPACAIFAVITVAIAANAGAQRLSDEELATVLRQLRSQRSEDRLAAADRAGVHGHTRAAELVPPLRQLLRSDEDWQVRAASGRALGRLEARDALPDLVRALRDDRAEVRVVAAAALWRIPEPVVVPALVARLEDRDETVRQWSATALGTIGDRRATAPLIARLRDNAKAVRIEAMRSLGRLNDAAAVEPLLRIARDERTEVDERQEAINAVASIASPGRVDALASLLDAREVAIKELAVRSLAHLADPAALPHLRRRLRTERARPLRRTIQAAVEYIEQQQSRPREDGSGGEGEAPGASP